MRVRVTYNTSVFFSSLVPFQMFNGVISVARSSLQFQALLIPCFPIYCFSKVTQIPTNLNRIFKQQWSQTVNQQCEEGEQPWHTTTIMMVGAKTRMGWFNHFLRVSFAILTVVYVIFDIFVFSHPFEYCPFLVRYATFRFGCRILVILLKFCL